MLGSLCPPVTLMEATQVTGFLVRTNTAFAREIEVLTNWWLYLFVSGHEW